MGTEILIVLSVICNVLAFAYAAHLQAKLQFYHERMMACYELMKERGESFERGAKALSDQSQEIGLNWKALSDKVDTLYLKVSALAGQAPSQSPQRSRHL